MTLSPFDNLPPLTKQEALSILRTPLKDLKLSSDYYKAIYHLSRYPSYETEEILLDFIKLEACDNSIKIAKRKAVEILGKFGCKRAIPLIALNLRSKDPYLVESSVLALQELKYSDYMIHKEVGSLLNDDRQNKRVLIQYLSKMNAISEVTKIKCLFDDQNIKPGIKGSSIAALYNLTGETKLISELANHLFLPNQNERQCAVQDIIDSKAISLLPTIIQSPISPSFKIRAISYFFPNIDSKTNIDYIFESIESVLIDEPSNIKLLHSYDSTCSLDLLINGLMSTDFSQGYASIIEIKNRNKNDIINYLFSKWDKLTNDYGAIYYLTILFRLIDIKDSKAIIKIKEMLFKCLGNYWPKYMKFRPTAIICLHKIDCITFKDYICGFLNEENNPYWTSRYATLMTLERYKIQEIRSLQKNIELCRLDSNRFVRAKATSLL